MYPTLSSSNPNLPFRSVMVSHTFPRDLGFAANAYTHLVSRYLVHSVQTVVEHLRKHPMIVGLM